MIRPPIGRIVVKRPMRVSTHLLKCVGYVAERLPSVIGQEEYDPYATGFFVGIRSESTGRYHALFVTAKHVADDLENHEIGFIANTKDGGTAPLSMASDKWFFHPTEASSVDIAVLPFFVDPNFDIVLVQTELFATPQFLEGQKMGLGDEVFFPGLFTFAPGSKAIHPIVRMGNVAMIPNGEIQVDGGFADVYLIESRSIGGLSGSPVFIRGTIAQDAIGATADDERFMGLSSQAYLFGVMHGHWDIASDINDSRLKFTRKNGVNMGISVVVPAHKLLEVINHPELVAMRARADAELLRSMTPTPDSK